MAEAPRIAACTRCNVALVPVQKRAMFSAGGAVGAIFVAAGVVALLVHLVLAAVLIVVGLVLSASSGKVTVMKCPQCGTEGATL